MAIDSQGLKSRRAILAAALGGAGAVAAQALAKPMAVSAAPNGNVQLGHGAADADNNAAAETRVTNTTAGQVALAGHASGSGIGVHGETVDGFGVQALATGGGAGVSASADAGVGVDTSSATGLGTWSRSTDSAGIRGDSTDSNPSNFQSASTRSGVIGTMGDTTNMSSNTDEIGVFGFADASASSAGVVGRSQAGWGVIGGGAVGVLGFGSWGVLGDVGPTEVGIYGNTGLDPAPLPGTGIGVVARAQSTAQVALKVIGRLQLNRSGRTSITAGHSSKVITMAGVSTASYVIATPQTNRSGLFVQAVVPAAGKFTIYLNKSVTATTYIGYIVIN